MKSKRKGKFYDVGHLKWDEFKRLREKLLEDDNLMLFGAITLGVYFGLRASDLLSLRWDLLIENGDPVDFFELWEQKTRSRRKKPRKFEVCQNAKDCIRLLQKKTNPKMLKTYVFSRTLDGHYSIMWLNTELKRAFKKHHVDYSDHVSSHLLRKTYGRRYWHVNEYSEKSIVILQHVFGHRNMATTMRYLGITEKEVAKSYAMLD